MNPIFSKADELNWVNMFRVNGASEKRGQPMFIRALHMFRRARRGRRLSPARLRKELVPADEFQDGEHDEGNADNQ